MVPYILHAQKILGTVLQETPFQWNVTSDIKLTLTTVPLLNAHKACVCTVVYI